MDLRKLASALRKAATLDDTNLSEPAIGFLKTVLDLEELTLQGAKVTDDQPQKRVLRQLAALSKQQRMRPPVQRTALEVVTEILRSERPAQRVVRRKNLVLAMVQVRSGGLTKRKRVILPRPEVSYVVVEGTVGNGWSATAKFWLDESGLQQLVALRNDQDQRWFEALATAFQHAPGWPDLTVSRPEIVFATAPAMYRGLLLKPGTSLSLELAGGPNLMGVLQPGAVTVQGRWALDLAREPTDYELSPGLTRKRRRELDEPPSKRRTTADSSVLLDLTSAPLSTLELPPVSVWGVRLALRSALDPELGFRVGQVAVYGSVTVGTDAVELWTTLPHDRGVLLLTTREGFRMKLPNLDGLVALTGGNDDWKRLFPDQNLIAGEVWLTELSVAFQLQQQVTSNITFTVAVDRNWPLGKNRDVAMKPTYIYWSVAFPADGAKRIADLQAEGTLVADGQLSFDATIDFGAATVTGYIDSEAGLDLHTVGSLPFVEGADWGDGFDPADFTEFRIVLDAQQYVVTAINLNAPTPRERSVTISL